MMKKNLPLWLLLSLVYGCGGGGGGDSSPPPEQPVQLSSSVSGGGVKGPLANASFALYKFDSSYINFQAATTRDSHWGRLGFDGGIESRDACRAPLTR